MPMSGKEMIKAFQTKGWKISRQRGSHVRMIKGNNFETIPLHRELKKGMEARLLRRLREVE